MVTAEHLKTLLEKSVSLFLIVDPLGVIPLYTALTSNMLREEKRKININTSITVVTILILSAFVGKYLLELFSLDIYSFQVAGGLILFALGIEMVHALESPMKRKKEEEEEASIRLKREEPIWIIPLSIPMLTGPVTISTMIIFFSEARGLIDKLWLLLTALFIGISVFLVLTFSDRIERALGKAGINVMSRLVGLILLGMAIKMIVLGIKGIWLNF